MTVCDGDRDEDDAEEGLAATLLCFPGDRTSKATAIMTTGTMQNAQTHPLEVAGFDKAVLLRFTSETPCEGKILGTLYSGIIARPEQETI